MFWFYTIFSLKAISVLEEYVVLQIDYLVCPHTLGQSLVIIAQSDMCFSWIWSYLLKALKWINRHVSACVNNYFPSNFVIRPLQGGTSLLYLDNMVMSSSLTMSFPIVRTFKTTTFHTRSKIKWGLKHSGVRMWKYKYLHINESGVVQIYNQSFDKIKGKPLGAQHQFFFKFEMHAVRDMSRRILT